MAMPSSSGQSLGQDSRGLPFYEVYQEFFVGPPDPGGGYDGCGVVSRAAASLHDLTRKGCPLPHP